MHLYDVYVVVCALGSLQICAMAFPTLVMPRWYGSSIDRFKKNSEPVSQQSDVDVLALEHLKGRHVDEPIVPIVPTDVETLPELERQLEMAVPSVDITTSTTEATASSITSTTTTTTTESAKHEIGSGTHRPPTLPHHDSGKISSNNGNHAVSGDVVEVPSMTKPFYGAARLAFGQNPEVLPTSSTSSTTTTSTTTILPATHSNTNDKPIEAVSNIAEVAVPENVAVTQSPEIAGFDEKENENGKKDIIGEQLAEVDQLPAVKTVARRSMTLLPSKTLAQYVFWTGDETGVARTIEEFIDLGLMSREGALKFLHDIRLNIDELQRSYKNRAAAEEEFQTKSAYQKGNAYSPLTTFPSSTSSTTTTTTTTTTEKPYPKRKINDEDVLTLRQLNRNSHLPDLSAWAKLQQLNNEEQQQDLSNFDEPAVRGKTNEFLNTEYTLEEVLYNLAKVMFKQSLAQGSDAAQRELQKLTSFLEREGNLGVIPVDVQRNVLNVLLTALSDTLVEHPELLPAASSILIQKPYSRYPERTYGSANLKI